MEFANVRHNGIWKKRWNSNGGPILPIDESQSRLDVSLQIEMSSDARTSGKDSSCKPILLLVEDDPSIRQLYKTLLGNQFRIVEAKDGEEGYAQAVENLPDYIFTDYHLPGCSGVELVKRLREIPAFSKTPVLISSGSLYPISDSELADLQCCRFLSKPARLHELRKTLQEMMTETS